MNAENVFIGITKDDEEVLLYIDTNNNKIINLQTSQEILFSDLKKNSLIPYTNLRKGKHQLKRTIVNTYNKDRKKELDVRNIFIGDINLTEKYDYVRTLNSDLPYMYRTLQFRHVTRVIKENALLYMLKKGDYLTNSGNYELNSSVFIDLETGITYNNADYDKVGGLFIEPNILPYLSEFDYISKEEEKQIILKKYRERRK